MGTPNRGQRGAGLNVSCQHIFIAFVKNKTARVIQAPRGAFFVRGNRGRNSVAHERRTTSTGPGFVSRGECYPQLVTKLCGKGAGQSTTLGWTRRLVTPPVARMFSFFVWLKSPIFHVKMFCWRPKTGHIKRRGGTRTRRPNHCKVVKRRKNDTVLFHGLCQKLIRLDPKIRVEPE